MQLAAASQIMHSAFARAVAPRRPLLVSEWAERHRVLSSKGSFEAGRWRNNRNPPQVEIMDCASARSPVTDVVAIMPIQFGKSEILSNIIGYTITENPTPIIVAFPADVSMDKFIDQKLNPLIDNTPAVQQAMVSLKSRESSNRRHFKDFEGGQLYLEHAGSPVRLKSTSAGLVVADEFSSFANELRTGDDPEAMLDGRTTAFPRAKRFKVGTPETEGACRLTDLYRKSDQRKFYVPCPHCGHEQPMVWAGMQWIPDGKDCWYVCRECGAMIREHEKTRMIARGRWVAENPGAPFRGYQINGLYYPVGLGPSWLELVREYLDAQEDPAKLKTFINDRLAEAYVDEAAKNVRVDVLRERAEAYALRTAPLGVLGITAGVDTQDDRLEVHIVGWGRDLRAWTLDYVVIPGDPVDSAVWDSLAGLLNAPILHESGALMHVEATAIDAGGHRTEDVKHFVRQRRIRRPMAIFGSRQSNALVLSRPKLADITWQGKTDKRGVHIYQVGTVEIKHRLYARIGADFGKAPEERYVHVPEGLPDTFYSGLVAEVFNPRRGRYEHRRGASRNEPLDTWVYAYAATHHHDLRWHRATQAKWDAMEKALQANAATARPSPAPPRLALPAVADSTVLPQRPAGNRLSIRQVVFDILTRTTRQPDGAVTPDDVARWRHVEPGTSEETRLHAELVMAVNAPGEAIGPLLSRDLLQRAQRYLSGLPTATVTTPSRPMLRRRVRSQGIH